MDLKSFKSSFLVVLWILFREGTASCSFPTAWTGTWYSSRRGELVINSTHLGPIHNPTTENVTTYECLIRNGNVYVIKSEQFEGFTGDKLFAYFCLEMTIMSSASIRYYHKTSQLVKASNERFKIYGESKTVTENEVCDETPTTTSWELLVKKDAMPGAAVDCPEMLQGEFNYTVRKGVVSSCGANSFWDGCSARDTPAVNTTLCNGGVAFSAGGVFQCVYKHVATDNYTYVLVVNLDNTTDESTTYRVTCMVMEAADGRVYVSQTPQKCETNQKPNSTTSAGATIVLQPFETCVATTTAPPVTTTTEATTTDLWGTASSLKAGQAPVFVSVLLGGCVWILQ